MPFGGIPRVNSEVLGESGTVPVPVAGEPVVDAVALEEEAPWEACTALCSAAVSWALTRSSASLFAMLARPCASVDTAVPIELISAVLAD